MFSAPSIIDTKRETEALQSCRSRRDKGQLQEKLSRVLDLEQTNCSGNENPGKKGHKK